MIRRPTKPSLTARAIGHSFGVLGAVMALNAIATSIDSRYLALFPFADTGIEQTPAGLIAVGLIALALWLVAERRSVRPKIDPPDSR